MIRLFLALAMLAGCSHSDGPDGARYLQMPPSLEEISGLAAASPNSVFAHDDELGMIYEIGLDDGHVIRAFALGDPTIEGDFEGIAADGDRTWLIESNGVIRAFRAGRDRTRVAYEEYDTGAGEFCEIEGLSLSPEPGKLLIACKNMLHGEKRGILTVFLWDTETHRPVARPWREIDLTEALGDERGAFAPSAIEWLPEFREILVLSARAHSLLRLDESGRVLARHRIDPDRHPQPEGVTLVGSSLVISDEGQGRGGGQIATYPYPLR